MRDGWKITCLGNLVDIKTGKLDANAMVVGGTYPFFTCAKEIYSIDKYAFDCEAILLAGNNASGDFNVKYYNGKFNAYQRTYVITVKDETALHYKYLMHLLINNLKTFKEESLGTNTKFLKIGMIQNMKIPLPPFSAQEHIVEILDKAFAAIDKAKANIEKNLQNTKALFDSYLQNILINKGKDWETSKLVEVTTKIGSGATPLGGGKAYKNTGMSLIRSLNIYDNEFRDKDLAFIDDNQASKLNNVVVEEDDVLFNITGASIARCCLVPKETLPARVNQHVSIIRVKKEIILPKFAQLSLISQDNKKQLLKTGEAGATRQAITKAQLEEFRISYPKSMDLQKTIVNKIIAVYFKTKNLEKVYRKKVDDLEELKKSILQKAFTGELTTATKTLIT